MTLDLKYSNFYSGNLSNLIKKIETEKNPVNFLNQYLSICQLYFDGLIDGSSNNYEDKKNYLILLQKMGKKL